MLTTITFLTLWTICFPFLHTSINLTTGILTGAILSSLLTVYTAYTPSSLVRPILDVTPFRVLLTALTIIIVLLIYLVSLKYEYLNMNPKLFNSIRLLLCIICVLFFITDHLLTFYILFEASLIPTLILILKWGYQPERLQAGTYFIIYTISASLPLLVALLYINSNLCSWGINNINPCLTLNPNLSTGLFQLCLILAFLVKVPIWGTHLWLPKAHVEAPVRGSIILAGILLKLGGYGLLKIFTFTEFIQTSVTNLLLRINLWGTIAVRFVCMRQIDIKRLIAYSSVIHIGLIVVGILVYCVTGWLGAALMILAHGLSSPGIFAIANFNYEITGSRIIPLQKGLITLYPASALCWFLLLAANMAAPPSLNLAGELLICAAALKLSFILLILLALSTFFAAVYNLYLYARQQRTPFKAINQATNINRTILLTRIAHIAPLFLFTLAIGVTVLWENSLIKTSICDIENSYQLFPNDIMTFLIPT